MQKDNIEFMIEVVLLDGSVKTFNSPSVSGIQIAETISHSLAQQAIAIKVDGELKDLSYILVHNAAVEIITLKNQEALDIIRHDAAHILAQAVKELYPKTQVAIGPSIQDGFYYDFARETPFSMDDLEKIQTKMQEIIHRGDAFARKQITKNEAIALFQQRQEPYKVEIVQNLPSDSDITIYLQGSSFIDLCKGPHAPSTKFVKAFKLTKLAGAYWHGNSSNTMLQRIYGTAWTSEEDLEKHLLALQDAEKRNHKKIGAQMDLFHFQDDAPGAVFWHPKGWLLFRQLIDYMRQKQHELSFVEINTPEVMDSTLWKMSGHWEKFREMMYIATAGEEERVYVMKPMNCPGCTQVLNKRVISYRDLPLRVSEFGKVHRFESSGALQGLMRLRAFTQDDAHVFCTESQIIEEAARLSRFTVDVHKGFGFEKMKIKLATRPEKRIGSDEMWDKAEDALLRAMKSSELQYAINAGEGAFYGPKLEFISVDALGRDWQLGTVQVDFNLPNRLGVSYTGEDGGKHTPVMLHLACLGSIERFLGILLEHYGSKLPLWLAPVQVAIVTINDHVIQYAQETLDELTSGNIRAVLDISNETLNYKIRQHSTSKVPIIAIIGEKESKSHEITVRKLGSNEQKKVSLKQFKEVLETHIESRNNVLEQIVF